MSKKIWLFMSLLVVASLLLVVMIAFRVQRVISAPILRLSTAAETVSTDADYSIRVERRGGDEIGVLCDGFNSMLAYYPEARLSVTVISNSEGFSAGLVEKRIALLLLE